MTLRNGKFYDDAGNVVPLEFGNKDQIKLIQQADTKLKDLQSKEGYLVEWNEMKVVMTIDTPCACGFTNIEFEGEGEQYDQAERDLDGQDYTCHHCDRHYILKEKSGDWIIKLVE